MFYEIAKRLAAWGYLSALDVVRIMSKEVKENDDVIRQAIYNFKERWGDKYGLSGGEDLDQDTIDLMTTRFCMCSDVVPEAVGGNKPAWAANKLSWQNDNVRVGSLSFSSAQDFAIEQIKRHCNMLLVVRTQESNLKSSSKYLDGPGGTLAQAYLPGYNHSPTRQLIQQFDTSEVNLSQDSFNLVVLHEICHSLGLSHDNSPQIALMDPFLNKSLSGLMPPDIKELVDRYGEPLPGMPTDDPGTQPKNGLTINIQGDIEAISIPGYKVVKI